MTTAEHLDEDALAISAQDEYYHNARERSLEDDGDAFSDVYFEKPPPPRKRPFYKKKRNWAICLGIVAVVVVVVVCLIVFVFFGKIAQLLVNNAGLSVNSAYITFTPTSSPQSTLAKRQQQAINMQTSCYMALDGSLSNTGPISGSVHFHNPVQVFYNDTVLGTLELPDTQIGPNHNSIVADTVFQINNTQFFTKFAEDMLVMDSFDWRLLAQADVSAIGRTATVTVDKTLNIAGMGGFKDIEVKDFQLPSDDPSGGVFVAVSANMVSPSPIGVQLGTIVLDITYQGVNLGNVTATNVTMKQGDNPVVMKGTIKPLSNPDDLAKVGDMISHYISGSVASASATGVKVAPDGTTPIAWLSNAFQATQLTVGIKNPSGPMQLIQSVAMGAVNMSVSQATAYSPSLSAPGAGGSFHFPFGISVAIHAVNLDLTMGLPGVGNFSTVSVPWTPAQSDTAAGKLSFGVNQAALNVIPGQEQVFNTFVYDITSSKVATLGIAGSGGAMATTAIGNITMNGININVSTTMNGLQFLNSTPSVISKVDLVGGTQDALQLAIDVSMFNPSDFTLAVGGDLVFNMFAMGMQLGTATLSNLTLVRGANTVTAIANFNPNAVPNGGQVLSGFIEGKNTSASISGFPGSTNIPSLQQAFEAVTISTTLPGMNQSLINGGTLTVPSDAPQTGTVQVAVNISNPFTAGLTLLSVQAAATYKGMPVGNINQDLHANPFVVNGHSTALSPGYNMSMNLEPSALALLMRNLAVDAHLDTKPLDALLGLAGFHVAGMEQIAPDPAVFNNFNISSYVMTCISALRADMNLNATLKVGDYVTTLAFTQTGVPVGAGPSVLNLLSIVALPLLTQILNGANMAFESVILSNPTEANAQAQIVGSITNAGPLAALIAFPQPLTVQFQGKPIASATLPSIQTVGNVGAKFNVSSTMTILDAAAMETFAAYMINNPSFDWTVIGTGMNATALDYTFTNISMTKTVSIKGCNGFKNAVNIENFTLPANDPAGGITLVASATMNNPSQVGFNIASVQFDGYYQGLYIGPMFAAPAVIAPNAVSSVQLKGRLIPQSDANMQKLTPVFENYLNATDSIVSVKGNTVAGTQGAIQWLTNAFKTLEVDNVALPGPKTKPNLIQSITIGNLGLDFTGSDQWKPDASSTSIQAAIKNPFGFPLGVASIAMDARMTSGSNTLAELNLPTQKASTDTATEVVTTQFSGVPLVIPSDSQDTFASFVKVLATSKNTSIGLVGTAGALATTAIGNIQLNGVAFDVTTSMAGTAKILSFSVTGGTKDYAIAKGSVELTNPSQVSISLGSISFEIQSQGTKIATVLADNVTLKPGVNQLNGVTLQMGGPTNIFGPVLTRYFTNQQSPLAVLGTPDSTKLKPLQQGLAAIRATTVLPGVEANILLGATVSMSLEELLAGEGKAIATVSNFFQTPYTVTNAVSKIYFNGTSRFLVGHVESISTPCTVPAQGTAVCDAWTVKIDANLIQLAEVVLAPEKYADLTATISATVGGPDGYSTTFDYFQYKIPAKLELDVGALGHLPLGGENPNTNSLISGSGTSAPASSTTKSNPFPLLPTKSASSTTSKFNLWPFKRDEKWVPLPLKTAV
ncbi:hypothetical protein BC940DRAFT_345216 [Gongronella butleri]|nr:hypothetical protein BC940DRAFT_345216 [Gongronella butleri]